MFSVTYLLPTTRPVLLIYARSLPNTFTSSCWIACGCCVLCGPSNGTSFIFTPFFPFSFDPNHFPGTATSQLLQPTSCSSQLKCWPRSCRPLVLFALQVQSRPMIHCRSLGQGRLTMLSVSCKRDWGFSFVGSRAMQRSSCGRVSLRFLLFSFFASFPAIKTI